MRYELFKDFLGEWRWRLLARNGEIIAVSGEGYKRKTDALHGIELVRETGRFSVAVEERPCR